MSTAFGSHVWVGDFIPSIYARVVNQVPGLTRDRVFSSLWDEADHLKWPPADRFVTGEILHFPVNQRYVDGGGNYNTEFNATLVLTAYVRLDADIENRSTQQLSDEVNGVWVFVQQIVAALQTWDGPTGSDGLLMFCRPMRILPPWTIRKKSTGDRARWALAALPFEVPFVANLGYAFDGTSISLNP